MRGVLYNTMSNFVIAIISLVSGLLGGYLIDLGTSLPISRVTGGPLEQLPAVLRPCRSRDP